MIALLGAAAVAVGPLLATLGLVRPLAGFGLFALGGLTSLIATVIQAAQLARGRGESWRIVPSALASIVFLGAASGGAGHPRINDFTTDLADPPVFRHAATLGPNAGRDLGYPADFAAIQRACCADLRAARVPLAAPAAHARARAVASRMPAWEVTAADPTAGTIEAVVTSGLFRFQDDVVIRVAADGAAQSRVDVRSKSRDGKGDLGANAARIRAYVAALEAATD